MDKHIKYTYDPIDEHFEKGLFYLSVREHLLIKKAIAYYLENQKYMTQEEYDDLLFLYGDLKRNKETETIDKEWL